MRSGSSLVIGLVLAFRSFATASEASPQGAPSMTVGPAGGISQTIPQGGPFVPASQTYTVTNTGTAPLDYTVTKSQPWVTVLPSGGTLAAGASASVIVSINGVGITLAPGSFADTVSFTNTTNNSGDQTRPVSLNVTAAGTGTLEVTSSVPWFVSVGHPGGPFAPTQTYTLSNTGSSSLDFAITADQSWVTASPASGSIAAGASTPVTFSVNSNANVLAAGTYPATLTFTNASNGNGNTTRPASLMISPPGVEMTVIPATAFTASGPAGGPFTPPNALYTITNVSPTPMTVSISKTQPWLDIAPVFTTISLAVGVSITYQVSLNSTAASLAPGTYTDTVTLTNVTSGLNNTTRTVTLTVTAAGSDTTPPTVTIANPTPPAASVTSSPATVSGTASDNVGITTVTWSNGRTGGSGTATGTGSWSASIPLAPGNNPITITALDAAGNRGSATIALDFAPPGGDTVAPTVLISNPTSAPTHLATASPQSLGGTASDNTSVTTVTWSNAATGGSGTATGTTTWSATVTLASGANVITVTAFDPSGNSSTATITVTLGTPAAGGGGSDEGDEGICGGSVAARNPGSGLGLLMLAAATLGLAFAKRR